MWALMVGATYDGKQTIGVGFCLWGRFCFFVGVLQCIVFVKWICGVDGGYFCAMQGHEMVHGMAMQEGCIYSSTVRSPWTRSCEKRRIAEAFGSKANKVGVKMEGRILFKQTKVVHNVAGHNVSKGTDYPQRQAHTRINYRSNVAGETISWAFVRYMNDLNTVRMYNWTGAIMTALMGPVKEFHRMPWKVTGYVVALLYWICEHSTIIEPQTDNMFPKFMKWDIGKLLSKAQGVDLSGPVNFQLDVVDCVGGDDAFVDELKGDGIHTEAAMHIDNLEFGFGDIREECSSWEGHKPDMTVGGNGANALHGSTAGKDNERVNDSKVNESSSAIAILELENKRKDAMIALLEEEIAGLKKKLEAQAVNIVGGFECVLGIKNDEVDKLKKENIELRRNVLVLEDQLTDRDVHVVTQAFQDMEVRRDGVGGSDAGVRVGGQVVHNVSPIRAHMGGAYMCNEAMGPDAKLLIRMVGIVGELLLNDGVIDVDDVVVTGNKWSGFDINNRLGVWKMMTVEEKCRIKQGYDRHGDRAVMWEDGAAGVDIVKNDDVRAMEKFVRTNVSAASECRFIHFPMCHDGHWTLVVYDTEDGTWKHYNPMTQRGDRADVHHNVATLLKERVTNVMKQTLRDFGLDEQSILANFSSSLEAMTKCLQQKTGMLDCGVIVCAIMRQYVHRCDVECSLQGTNCIILRANMWVLFLILLLLISYSLHPLLHFSPPNFWVLGLFLPCPSNGLFGNANSNYCLKRQLIDCPIETVSSVQLSVNTKFPFDSIDPKNPDCQLNLKLIKDQNNCVDGFVEMEGEASCSSISGARKLQNVVERDLILRNELVRRFDVVNSSVHVKKGGFDLKGKGIVNQRPRNGLRRRRKGLADYAKVLPVSYDPSYANDQSHFTIDREGNNEIDAVHCQSALELMLITLIVSVDFDLDDEDTPVVKNFGDRASHGFQLDGTLHEKKLA
ncbi:hypothetical protein TEA_009663 [Camellia sinensis var. sinensis]|uniref:Ubiquitin-like protease family profile domain-containing protein n=1 Tax=Camellia sinensis var. sinensis TaxID=542762 RepID=A0A4S4DX90_CAMSN|nr:hypothetical protein TEA_009663 [Camellia sinensis var. sinensis]